MPYALLTLTVLFWSGNFVIGRGIHGVVPPVSLAFWRWAVALTLLLPFALRPMMRQRALIRRHWKLLSLLAILSVTNFNTFIYHYKLNSSDTTDIVISYDRKTGKISSVKFTYFRYMLVVNFNKQLAIAKIRSWFDTVGLGFWLAFSP